MMKRRRFRQSTSLKERLESFAQDMRKKASVMPPGPKREALIKRADQAGLAIELENWVNSPELQPPRSVARLARENPAKASATAPPPIARPASRELGAISEDQ